MERGRLSNWQLQLHCVWRERGENLWTIMRTQAFFSLRILFVRCRAESPGVGPARPPLAPIPGSLARRAVTYQSRSDAFIEHIQGPEAPSAVHGITHEIYGPDCVGLWDHGQRLADSNR